MVFLIIAIHDCPKFQGKRAITGATLTLAAKLIKRGRTAHSAFNVPVPCAAADSCSTSVDYDDAQML